jgi:hypothetical protein
MLCHGVSPVDVCIYCLGLQASEDSLGLGFHDGPLTLLSVDAGCPVGAQLE